MKTPTPSAQRQRSNHSHRAWGEIIGLFLAYNAYEFARAQAGSESAGRRHALQIVRFERWAHMAPEPAIQRFFASHLRLIQSLNAYYGVVHFIAPIVVLWALWNKPAPDRYRLWRNSLVSATLLALVVFWLWPLMPPRLLPGSFGFTDTNELFGGTGILDSGPQDGNPYAAMPSLHVGWAVWCAAAAGGLTQRKTLRTLFWLYPALTILVVLATGNHYWIDVPGGIVVDLCGGIVGVAVTRMMSRRRRVEKSNALAGTEALA